LHKRISAVAVAALVALAAVAVRADDARVTARSAGSDLPTARRIAAALLVRPLPAQLLHVRCERVGAHADCGLVLSGVKFHRTLDLAAGNAEVAQLIVDAYAAAPGVDEIDCWATVPLDAGRGTVVSGDFRQAGRGDGVFDYRAAWGLAEMPLRLRDGRGVFWDPAFRAAAGEGDGRMIRISTLPTACASFPRRYPTCASATVGVWCDVGSAAEPAERRGISHLLEHMVFKGTRRRTARAIAEEMDAVGGELNAMTDKETTCFYAHVIDRHLPRRSTSWPICCSTRSSPRRLGPRATSRA